jgi:hypothetical protein
MNQPEIDDHNEPEQVNSPVRLAVYAEFENGFFRVENALTIKQAEEQGMISRIHLENGGAIIIDLRKPGYTVTFPSEVNDASAIVKLKKTIPVDSNCSGCGAPLPLKNISLDTDNQAIGTQEDKQPCAHCLTPYTVKQEISDTQQECRLIADETPEDPDFEGTSADLEELIKKKEKSSKKTDAILLTTGAISLLAAFCINNPDIWAQSLQQALLQLHRTVIVWDALQALEDAYRLAYSARGNFWYGIGGVLLFASLCNSPDIKDELLIQENASTVFPDDNSTKRMWVISDDYTEEEIDNYVILSRDELKPTGSPVTIEESDETEESEDSDEENENNSGDRPTPDIPDDCSIETFDVSSSYDVWVIRDNDGNILPIAGAYDSGDVIQIVVPVSALEQGWQIMADDDPDDPNLNLPDLYKVIKLHNLLDSGKGDEDVDSDTSFGTVKVVNLCTLADVPKWVVGMRRANISVDENAQYVIAEVPDEKITNIIIQRKNTTANL